MIPLSSTAFFLVLSVVQSLEVQVQNGSFSQPMHFTLNSTIRQILVFEPRQNENPYRIEAWTLSANSDYPILIEVQLEQNSLSWTVPLVVQTSNGTQLSYSNTSRILCNNNSLKNDSRHIQNFTVTLSTSSNENVDLSLEVEEDDMFFVTTGVNYTVYVSQSVPRSFFYKFDCKENRTIFIDIDSSDDVCLTASIQKNQCPIIDLDQGTLDAGIHHTIKRDGGVRIDKRNYPNGFSLVFVVKVDNDLCDTRLGPFVNQVPRISNETISKVSFSILMGVDWNGYRFAILMLPFFILIFYLIVLTIVCMFFCLEKSTYFPLSDDIDDDVATENSSVDNLHQVADNDSLRELLNELKQVPICENVDETDHNEGATAHCSKHNLDKVADNGNLGEVLNAINRAPTFEEVDENESVTDGVRNASNDQQNSRRSSAESVLLIPQRQNGTKTLEELSQNEETNRRKSHRYCKYTQNVAIFYILPVFQLMITYQNVVNRTGNTDVCYYNFRCANPGPWFSSDLNPSAFNNVYSNIGYLFMGLLFLGVVRHRQWYLPKRETGVPANYGIFYGMGIALIAESVLSGCYHICPNRAHFQFDTSFMYVMAVLSMVKLYQNRHQDIAPSACWTFTVVALIICFAMVGLLESNHDIALGSVVGIGYVILCTFLSLKIYYFGSVLRQLRLWTQAPNIFEALRPQEKSRFIVVVLANIINYAMLISVEIFYVRNELNFGTLLLVLLMANAVLYALTYTVMKLVYGERIKLQAIIYGLMSLVSWFFGGYYYLDGATEWNVSPAQSRSWNQPCAFLKFYDKHDLWHLFSSAALFLNFMYLLCLDDDIIHTSRRSIYVF